MGNQAQLKVRLEITNLSEHRKQTIEQLEHHLHDDHIKARDKAEKKAEKEKVKSRGKEVKKAAKEGELVLSVDRIYSYSILMAALMLKVASLREG